MYNVKNNKIVSCYDHSTKCTGTHHFHHNLFHHLALDVMLPAYNISHSIWIMLYRVFAADNNFTTPYTTC